MIDPTYRTLGKRNPEAIAVPLESATVSCAGLDITVACDDHGTKDAIMDILCGCDTPCCIPCKTLRAERDVLALRVMTLEAERDNAVAAKGSST